VAGNPKNDAPRLMAVFRPQHWVRDYATDCGGNTEFDATDQFLRMSADDIADFELNNYDSDNLANHLPEYMAHHGPFEVDVDLDEWLEDHGIEDRSQLTNEQWAAIKAKYPEQLTEDRPATSATGRYEFRHAGDALHFDLVDPDGVKFGQVTNAYANEARMAVTLLNAVHLGYAPTLDDIAAWGRFYWGGHDWELKSDQLGWKTYCDGQLHNVYAMRAGVAEDIINDLGIYRKIEETHPQ